MRIARYNYPSYSNILLTPSLFGRSPWSGLESEIDRLFASTVGVQNNPIFPVDLYEDEADVHVRAELPGVNREDIQVEMVEGDLSISAVRKTPAAGDQPEQAFSFSRSLSIPADVATDKVSAAYENGILTVTLPKREEAKAKKIAITVK
ncbi:MAG: Hsp20/alpha crystallin family protein [Verrucomicrobia bacterium]|nr:Hsp20/alpha crystallin family protein [Verrucomicrobiota bacterium]